MCFGSKEGREQTNSFCLAFRWRATLTQYLIKLAMDISWVIKRGCKFASQHWLSVEACPASFLLIWCCETCRSPQDLWTFSFHQWEMMVLHWVPFLSCPRCSWPLQNDPSVKFPQRIEGRSWSLALKYLFSFRHLSVWVKKAIWLAHLLDSWTYGKVKILIKDRVDLYSNWPLDLQYTL